MTDEEFEVRMAPARGCETPADCYPQGWMDRCDICQRQFAFRERMTWEDYEVWRSHVLDTHHHPEKYQEGVDYLVLELPSPFMLADNDNAVGVVSED